MCRKEIFTIVLCSIFFLITIPAYSSLSFNTVIHSSGEIRPNMQLHVDGNKIKNSANNTFILRGINQHTFGDYPMGSWQKPDGSIEWNTFNPVMVASNLDAMKSWGINVVRMYGTSSFWIDNTENHRQIVKDLLTLMASRGMYLDYSFWHNIQGNQQEAPFPSTKISDGKAFAAFWGSIAADLKDYPNVIFSLWNEPVFLNMNVDDWFNAVQLSVTAIRATGAKNLIIIQWGGIGINESYGPAQGYPIAVDAPTAAQDALWWVAGKPITDPTGNLVYEFHNYRGGIHKFVNGTRVDVWETLDLNYGYYTCGLIDYVLNTLHKPVICGEIGPNMWQTGTELQHELDYYKNSLALFNTWGISYIGFWWWPTWTYAHLQSGPNYQPNQAGQILIDKIAGR